jgi:hypothetical protein
MLSHYSSVALAGFGLALSLAAQDPAELGRLADQAAVPFDWRIPIHTGQDDPEGGPYGIWATGADHKVSFHNGFEFVPILGPDAPETLSWRWTTTSVRIGDAELWNPHLVRGERLGDWAYAYRSGAVTERYDLREAGPEQSFVIERRPGGPLGDLVVRGAVDSSLATADREPAHGTLTFRDRDGRDLVDYGAAWAIDAIGRRLDVKTAVVDGAIELRVPAAWLADAAFPVVVDPLVSVSTITSGSFLAPPIGCDIVDDPDSTGVSWIQYTRAVSSRDTDIFGVLYNHALRTTQTLFADVTTSWSSQEAQVTYSAPGTKRYAVAYSSLFSSGRRLIRCYIHPATSRTLNAGRTVFLGGPAGLNGRPTIGAESADAGGLPRAFLAWEVDASPFRVVGCLVDLAAGTFTTPVDVGLGNWQSFERRNPCITRVTSPEWLAGDAHYFLCYSQANRSLPTQGFSLALVRIERDGSRSLPYLTRSPSGRQCLHPQVTATLRTENGRRVNTVAVSYTSRPTGSIYSGALGDRAEVKFLGWDHAAGGPSLLRDVLLESASTAIISTDTDGQGIAIDASTRTNFVAAYTAGNRTVLARLSLDGHIQESIRIRTGNNPWGRPSVCARPEGAYTATWIANESGTVYLRTGFVEHAGAAIELIQTGCNSGGWRSWNGDPRPHKGNLDLAYVTFIGTNWLVIGLRRGTWTAPGMDPSCPLLLDPASIVTVIPGTGGFASSVPLPIPGNVPDLDLLAQPIWSFSGPVSGDNLYRLRIR